MMLQDTHIVTKNIFNTMKKRKAKIVSNTMYMKKEKKKEEKKEKKKDDEWSKNLVNDHDE